MGRPPGDGHRDLDKRLGQTFAFCQFLLSSFFVIHERAKAFNPEQKL